jgi:hypothetical protein
VRLPDARLQWSDRGAGPQRERKPRRLHPGPFWERQEWFSATLGFNECPTEVRGVRCLRLATSGGPHARPGPAGHSIQKDVSVLASDSSVEIGVTEIGVKPRTAERRPL